MATGLDWGSVPDYLPALTIFGGFVYAVRTWRRERQEARQEAVREQAMRETGAAMVFARLVPPKPPVPSGSRALSLEVRNHSEHPVFDVEVDLRYVGPVHDVPDLLRVVREEETALPADGRVRVLREAELWPPGTYREDDFDWSIRFRDVHGQVWRRGRRGLPVPGDAVPAQV